eukprot:CAMPEP_0116055812 /NCGR_PEP_ID=MMETSP0322-20121206/3631_1 /TAXON_ID=163516 /ORGANISM="Leptocylindrus danicus var. apora, Strain B651" /LENGTH=503 /DNA_ID=CAMNT_0003539489 /DNA_START=134 /DNA_END=1642 /DNA_ORIENTATION=+
MAHRSFSAISAAVDGNSKMVKEQQSLTKIVATIGPTSEQYEVLSDLVTHGLRIMRLNFSHATVEEVELRVKNLRMSKGMTYRDEDGMRENFRAVLLDTRGPEIRTGKLADDTTGKKKILLEKDSFVTLHSDDSWKEKGSAEDLYVDYPYLSRDVTAGRKVLLDDGAVTLTVIKVLDDSTLQCVVDNDGNIRSRAGVNLPGVVTDLPAMSEKDKADILYGISKDVDFIAPSFIQDKDNVYDIRNYVDECISKLGLPSTYIPPRIISKIESLRGLQNFQEILDASDGIMVARGDLGVEIPIHSVTNAQKEMIMACNEAGKPVIVATQMLESMSDNPRPTRAEVADVTNAVYDGADAVMLSGETAKGKYPRETVITMNEIIREAEHFIEKRPDIVGSSPNLVIEDDLDLSNFCMAKATVTAAVQHKASAILVHTSSGKLARAIAAYRPNIPIIACLQGDDALKIGRQLMIHRGIHPVIIHPSKGSIDTAKEIGFIDAGDHILLLGP